MKRSIQLIVLSLLSTFAVFAENFDWGNTYAQVWQGFGTGPYVALGDGVNPQITIFCMDFNDEIAPPFNWDATVLDLTPAYVQTYAQYGGNYNNRLNAAYGAANPGQPAPNQISPFVFVTDDAGGGYGVDLSSSMDAYTRYLEAAWLFSLLQASGPQSSTAVVAQVAAWSLFVDGNHQLSLASRILATNANGNVYGFQDLVGPPATAMPTVSGLNFRQAVDYALTAAQKAVVVDKTFTGSGWTIVTGDPIWVESAAGKMIPAQEFLSPNAVDPPPPVPEPTAVVLLGTVVGLVGFVKRQKRA